MPSRAVRSAVGYTAGCVTAVVGVWLLAGLAIALMTGGVVAAASSLLLIDVDEGGTRG